MPRKTWERGSGLGLRRGPTFESSSRKSRSTSAGHAQEVCRPGARARPSVVASKRQSGESRPQAQESPERDSFSRAMSRNTDTRVTNCACRSRLASAGRAVRPQGRRAGPLHSGQLKPASRFLPRTRRQDRVRVKRARTSVGRACEDFKKRSRGPGSRFRPGPRPSLPTSRRSGTSTRASRRDSG